MSPSSPVVLASGAITRSGDTLNIELHQPAGHPPTVLLRWPPEPTVCNAHPRAIAAVAAATVQLLATAQAELARLRANEV